MAIRSTVFAPSSFPIIAWWWSISANDLDSTVRIRDYRIDDEELGWVRGRGEEEGEEEEERRKKRKWSSSRKGEGEERRGEESWFACDEGERKKAKNISKLWGARARFIEGVVCELYEGVRRGRLVEQVGFFHQENGRLEHWDQLGTTDSG